MEKKEAYIEKLSAQLREWSAKIDEMKVQASLAKAEAKDAYRKQLEIMGTKKADAEKRLHEMKNAGEGAWQDLKAGMDRAVDELKRAVSSAAEKMKDK